MSACGRGEEARDVAAETGVSGTADKTRGEGCSGAVEIAVSKGGTGGGAGGGGGDGGGGDGGAGDVAIVVIVIVGGGSGIVVVGSMAANSVVGGESGVSGGGRAGSGGGGGGEEEGIGGGIGGGRARNSECILARHAMAAQKKQHQRQRKQQHQRQREQQHQQQRSKAITTSVCHVSRRPASQTRARISPTELGRVEQRRVCNDNDSTISSSSKPWSTLARANKCSHAGDCPHAV